MDKGHLENSELEKKFQKYEGRVVLRGAVVKDDSGSYAVFAEQGSSVSHMTAAKVFDVISTFLDCAGEASDAVSAYTRVKMEDAPDLSRLTKIRMFSYLDTSTTLSMSTLMGQNTRPCCTT